MLRFTLAQLYKKNSQYEAATIHLNKAVELDNQYTAAWNLLGQCYNDQNQTDAARTAFEHALTAARVNGDKQMEKMVQVFLKRLNKTN